MFDGKYKKDIFFLIVNYQGSKDTVAFIKNINSSVKKGDVVRIIIIDNKSDKKDIQYIKLSIENYNNVSLLELDSNVGYFPAFNVAIDVIRDYLPATVILCNNDLTINPNFIDRYLVRDYLEDVFVVAPNVITLNGVHQNPLCLRKVSMKRKILYKMYFSSYTIARIFKFCSRLIRYWRNQLKKIVL